MGPRSGSHDQPDHKHFLASRISTAEAVFYKDESKTFTECFHRLWMADLLDPECQQLCRKVSSGALAGARRPDLRNVQSAVPPRSTSC